MQIKKAFRYELKPKDEHIRKMKRVSLGIILKYRSALSPTAFVALLLLLVVGTYGTLVLLRKLPDGKLWLFYIAVAICCVCNALFIMAVNWNMTVFIPGGLPFALLLAPTLVTSLVFMTETGTGPYWPRSVSMPSLPVLILATLQMAFWCYATTYRPRFLFPGLPLPLSQKNAGKNQHATGQHDDIDRLAQHDSGSDHGHQRNDIDVIRRQHCAQFFYSHVPQDETHH